ncbi:alpha/beta hydrolase [soil metagenome]
MPPALSLAYWLGPWAEGRSPAGVTRRTVRLESPRGDVSTYVYDARERPRGIYVVAQGMHYLGPDDPRLDRFCRVLARAGFRVYAPMLRDFLALRMAETAADDLALAVTLAAADARLLDLAKPTLMSISFGSRPAITVASGAHADEIASLILFGGFVDFDATIRFAITGRATHEARTLSVARDPLNAPVVFLNLLPFLETEARRDVVAEAWREMVVRTWGKMELKVDGARDAIARDIAERLTPIERDLFLRGCTLCSPAAAERLLDEGLVRAKSAFSWTDPHADLARVRAPITIVHGRDDDVIPVFEAEKLACAVPSARLLVTGMYGHTGSAFPSSRALAAELTTLARVVRTLAQT